MKIAVVFLIAALSSCFNAATVPQGNCLQQLLEDDAPLLLEKLSQLLCNYKVAQQQKNNALFLAFINEVNVLLEKVGCTINNIIGINVTPTINNAEAIADQIATALFQYLEGLIAKVSKILQNIPIIGSILNDKILVQDIQNVGCGVLADIISEVDKILRE
ncbi:hypothetical protein XELAEV_18017271mg [Xenopus laevis]|uniref:Uncharacterized protein n=1 Tax=Xenopus laevis TaxID=8355 RepID=A0A974DDC8_XENLA|nr:hypothetical protein XELAEV_18017271mg [Xenopus laevis]